MSEVNRGGAAQTAQKSFAQIVAKIRHDANLPRQHIIPDGYGEYTIVTLDRDESMLALADDLEAAYKIGIEEANRDGHADAMNAVREVVLKIGPLYNAECIGNTAKLRTALETVRDAHFVREENGEDCEGFDVEADDGTGRPLICVVEDALAGPARNCDSYDSADEMMEEYADDAFLEEWKEWRKSGKCHPLMIDAFLCINWLFLTNKKGDSDGSK